MKQNILLFLSGLFVACTLHADDGLKFLIKNKPAGEKAKHRTIYVGDHHLRMEGDDNVMLYNDKKESLIFLRPDKKEYTELTKEERDSLKKVMGQMQQMIEERMKNVPEGQRAMVKKMLKKRFGDKMEEGENKPIEFTETGTTKSVNGWPSEKIIGKREGEKVYEYWVTDYASANVKPGELSVMKHFSKHMKSLIQQLPVDANTGNFESIHRSLNEQNKIPVRTIHYKDGKKTNQHDITSIEHVDINPGLFTVPDGYTEQEGGL